jgi:hypothetical protein
MKVDGCADSYDVPPGEEQADGCLRFRRGAAEFIVALDVC